MQDPNYQVTSDIPPDSPLHQSPQQPSRRREGVAGGLVAALLAVWAWGKYVLLFAFKFKFFATFLTSLISFGAYALWLGPWAAAGIVVMFLVHELGHVYELRRQGLKTSAVVLVPFLGAATIWRSEQPDPIKRAEIAIAGPVAGTIAATVAFVLYGTTHSPVLLFWAYFGFFLNLLNLIPFSMLDGGAILAPASKWFQVLGLAALIGLVFFAPVSPILLVVIVLGLPGLYERFRNQALDAYLTSGPVSARYALAGVWLAIVVLLSYAFFLTEGMLRSFVR